MPAKKSAKKPAAKKTAAKKSVAKKTTKKKPDKPEPNKKLTKAEEKQIAADAERRGSGFSILDRGEEWGENMKNYLTTALAGKKGRQINFKPQASLEAEYLPWRSFLMKEATESPGLLRGTVLEVIGRDSLGKSSLIYNFLAGFMINTGSPCCVVVGDGKPQSTLWAKRTMTSDPVLAEKLVKGVYVVKTAVLDEMAEMTETWIKGCRDASKPTYVPLSVPIVVVVDLPGKIATKEEAAGIVAYAGYNDPKVIKAKEITGGSNFSRAKWMAEWLRKLHAMSVRWNITLILSSHQNDKMDIKAGAPKKPSFLPQWQEDAKNRVKNGGNASNQSSALQLVLVDRGYYYADKKPVARRVTASVYKNSFGASKKIFDFAIKEKDYNDRPGYLDQGLRLDYPLVHWLADRNYLDVRRVGDSATEEKFSSKLLGFTSVTIVEAAEHLTRPEVASMIHELGTKLMIPGYVDLYAEIMKKVAVQQPAESKDELPPEITQEELDSFHTVPDLVAGILNSAEEEEEWHEEPEE